MDYLSDKPLCLSIETLRDLSVETLEDIRRVINRQLFNCSRFETISELEQQLALLTSLIDEKSV